MPTCNRLQHCRLFANYCHVCNGYRDAWQMLNTPRQDKNVRQVTDDIFKWFILTEDVYVVIKFLRILLQPVSTGTGFHLAQEASRDFMMTSLIDLFPRYWLFVWGIHRSPVNSPHKGPVMRTLMFLWYGSVIAVKQTFEWPVVWDDMTFIWRHRNVNHWCQRLPVSACLCYQDSLS